MIVEKFSYILPEPKFLSPLRFIFYLCEVYQLTRLFFIFNYLFEMKKLMITFHINTNRDFFHSIKSSKKYQR